MAHGLRFMQQVGSSHWVVKCRCCGKRYGKREFATARECHEWWRDHQRTDDHANAVADRPNRLARLVKMRRQMEAIFGPLDR